MSIDGVADLEARHRVLLLDQGDPVENGIWEIREDAWVRPRDADQNREVTSGAFVYVSEGTDEGGKTYQLVTPDPIELGVTSLEWVEAGGEGEPAAPDGILTFDESAAPFTQGNGTTGGDATTVINDPSIGFDVDADTDYLVTFHAPSFTIADDTEDMAEATLEILNGLDVLATAPIAFVGDAGGAASKYPLTLQARVAGTTYGGTTATIKARIAGTNPTVVLGIAAGARFTVQPMTVPIIT